MQAHASTIGPTLTRYCLTKASVASTREPAARQNPLAGADDVNAIRVTENVARRYPVPRSTCKVVLNTKTDQTPKQIIKFKYQILILKGHKFNPIIIFIFFLIEAFLLKLILKF